MAVGATPAERLPSIHLLAREGPGAKGGDLYADVRVVKKHPHKVTASMRICDDRMAALCWCGCSQRVSKRASEEASCHPLHHHDGNAGGTVSF